MYKIILLTISAFLTLTGFSQSLAWQWATSAGGNLSDYSRDLATDGNGDVYTIGKFNSPTITFGSNTYSSMTYGSCYLLKQNSSGTVLWSKVINASGSSIVSCGGICTDKNGFVYVTGDFQGTITFGTTTLTANGQDFFLVKYDASGNVIWAKNTGTYTSAYGYDVTADKVGNVYVSGVFVTGTMVFGSTTLNNTSAVGGSDVYLAKYNSSGTVVWANTAGGPNIETPESISADSLGNVYIIGQYFGSSMSFGSTTLNNSVTNNSSCDIFMAKYDVSGALSWAKSAGGVSNDWGRDVRVDHNGNVHATGAFSGSTVAIGTSTLIGNGSCANSFMITMDPNYNTIWAKSFASNSNNNGYKIVCDASGNSYVAGDFFFSMNIGGFPLTCTGVGPDIYVVKMDPLGTVVAATSAGGNRWEYLYGMSVDKQNNCFLTGAFLSNSCNFGSAVVTKDTSNNTDIYLAKLSLVTGINERNAEISSIDVFPNPFSSSATIRFNEEQALSQVKIIDLFGKEVRSGSFSGSEFVINKGEIKPGVYFIQVTDENRHVLNKKIIIQ